MKHSATIHNGRPVFDNPQAWTIDCAKLNGQKVVVELSKPKRSRSNNQNAYLFGVVMPILCDVIGYPDSQSSECWASVKIAVGFCDDTKLGKVPRSSAGLSTVEFEDLMSRVRTFASVELGAFIPAPNEEEQCI